MRYAKLGKLREYKGAAVIFVGTVLAALALSLIWVSTASADHVCQLNPNPSFSVNERSSVSLSAGSTNCQSINWDFDNDGAYDDGSGTTITFAAGDRDGPGSQIVGIEGVRSDWVCDPETHACMFEDDYAYAQTTINIGNAPPTATGVNTSPSTINEGSDLSLSLAGASDVSADMVNLQYLLACPNGTFSSSTTNSRVCSTTDSGSFTVRGMARDKDGGQSIEHTKTVTINNVNPTATGISAPNSVNEGSDIPVSLANPTDASSVDRNSLRYRFDCDDGSGYNGSNYATSGSSNGRTCSTTDNDERTVKGRVMDKDGGESIEHSRTVTVNNVAPTGNLTSPTASVDEGTPVTISFTNQFDPSTADTSAGFHYAYDCNGGLLNDKTYANSGTSTSVDCTFEDGPATKTVSARIIDKDGGSTLVTRGIAVNNVGPQTTLSAGNPLIVTESSTVRTYNFSVSDPGDDTVQSVVSGCGDHGTKVTNSDSFDTATNQGSFQCRFPDGSKSSVVSITATDDDGGAGNTATQTVNIANVAPTATGINAPNSVRAGNTFTISLANPTDASDADKGSLQYRFDCGDGSGYNAFSSTNSRSCPTSAPGNRTVRGQVRDKDNDASVVYRKTVKVLPLLTITDRRLTEGDSGSKSAVFTVRLSSASQQKVTVNYATANGTAKAPGDYTAKSGTISFAPGETAKTISVAVKGDRLKEPNEIFFVRLSGATNAAIADASGQGTIVNND